MKCKIFTRTLKDVYNNPERQISEILKDFPNYVKASFFEEIPKGREKLIIYARYWCGDAVGYVKKIYTKYYKN